MASKLKVDELRCQLRLRGPDETGTKPFLVNRLESAIRREVKEKNSSKDGHNGTKKRSTESQEILEVEGDGNVALNGSSKRPKKSIDEKAEERVSVEELKKLTMCQLRELATCRCLPENGTKKELMERLSVDVEKDSGENIEGKDAEGRKEKKLIAAIKKGGAVLDQWLPDDIKSSFHVLQWGQEIYDATLNQTNVGSNNDNFYVIQALESDDGGKFFVYNRWGRVGVRGLDKLHGPFTSREQAIAVFEMKFSDKTWNQWRNRKNFTCYPKCYTWLEMDCDEAEKETAQKKTDVSIGTRLQKTKLEPRIAKFIALICNINMMEQQMLEIGYNSEKLPFDKISKITILKAYDVLRRISYVISKPDRKTLEQLSG